MTTSSRGNAMFSIHDAAKTKREYDPAVDVGLYPFHAEPWIPEAIDALRELEDWGPQNYQLTPWEVNFAASLEGEWKTHARLSHRQFLKLKEIMHRADVDLSHDYYLSHDSYKHW